jgi:hypothetical protein
MLLSHVLATLLFFRALYSDTLFGTVSKGRDAALSQIHVDADKFESRGGNYEIRKPMKMAS